MYFNKNAADKQPCLLIHLVGWLSMIILFRGKEVKQYEVNEVNEGGLKVVKMAL